jgi:hypothetical protein
MMEIIMDLKSASMFLDGSKDPVRLKHLLAENDYRPWLIHLIRDGRAVMNSAMKNEGQSAENAAREWFRTHEQIERLARALNPNARFVLRYEDLCTRLEESRSRLFAFLALAERDAATDYRAVDHHILGNRMRLAPTGEVRLDEKWKTLLRDSDLATFERIAGAMNRAYGYNH